MCPHAVLGCSMLFARFFRAQRQLACKTDAVSCRVLQAMGVIVTGKAQKVVERHRT